MWAAPTPRCRSPAPKGDELEIYFSSRDAAGRSQIGRATIAADLHGELTFEQAPLLAPGELGTFDDSGVTSRLHRRRRRGAQPLLLGLDARRDAFRSTSTSAARVSDGRRPDLRACLAGARPRAKRGRSVPDRLAVDPRRERPVADVVRLGHRMGGARRARRSTGTTSSTRSRTTVSSGGATDTSASTIATKTSTRIARPWVVRDGDRYRMWFCSRGDRLPPGLRGVGRRGHLGPPRRRGRPRAVQRPGWDSEMVCVPGRLRARGRRYLLYNGNGYGATGIGYAARRPSRERAGDVRRVSTSESFDHLPAAEERSFWFRSRNELIVWALRRYFPDARSLLEVGCGTGFVLGWHSRGASRSCALVGAELFAAGLDVAAKRVPDAELLQMDARRIPFRNEFDVVGAFDVLEHIDEDEQALRRDLRRTPRRRRSPDHRSAASAALERRRRLLDSTCGATAGRELLGKARAGGLRDRPLDVVRARSCCP